MEELQQKIKRTQKMNLSEEIIASMKVQWSLQLTTIKSPTTEFKIKSKYSGHSKDSSLTDTFDEYNQHLKSNETSYKSQRAF